MFLKERQDAIVEQINACGRVTVSDLAARYEVTEDCIRKDLKTLADQGVLKRVYGGAIIVRAKPELNARKRIGTNATQKRAIAEKALAQIEDGDTIFLDVSTTNLALAQAIAASQRTLTVVSNMVDILQALAVSDAVTAIGTGGTMNLDQDGFYGAYTQEFLRALHFDRAFIGALGVDLGSGDVLTFDLDDGLTKRAAMQNAACAYLMVDANKFGAGGTYRFATLEDFDVVVTDKATPATRRAIKRASATCL
ncbi:MAG: DeoR/GlpR family DNA-binding transcription regulator [Atopobiaceae bacterium]|jgi:DeoR family glycerol-3-phosphate regulon repressor|nr:DeoR/GlpR family DNA-binding transcription regulator [Atopobiaceae bacterium]MCH4181264.1 DeoR/GlpR family DNA-binding transcription regulator [Atopobiaceae bacterium]MCH4214794.1 DeoR/GlpR family DNA-binding transcription regulator [Atopobiaceae bacterium]MCH4276818.1 DeoR/GlpR family DNA-binding transcription regulator [Atopobiaceae bacterium]MCI1226163.1 DeoR/GlpR family DNA-binding transcription regulator [Atopobiaceae bacterium]